MRNLSTSEKRTIRLGIVVLAVYFTFTFGQKAWNFLQKGKADYRVLTREAAKMRADLRPYREKILITKKLMEDFRMDPAKLSKQSVVADASAAILKAATTGGVQLGPIRETGSRQSGRELTSMQLDCTGPIPSVLAFLHKFQSIGFPIILDSIQLSSEASRPGTLKLHLGLVILDFEQWKAEEIPNAR
jgi:hypothetical protein